MSKSRVVHHPVLLKEAVDLLAVIPGGRYIDATAGAAGHSAEIIKRGGSLLGLDLDPQMLKAAKTHLETVCPDGDWRLKQGNFADIMRIAREEDFIPADGAIFDLGLSTYHYLKAKKGFSFKDKVPLDMRISGKGQTVADLLNKASEEELIEIFTKFGQERFAPQIARMIVRKHRSKMTAAELGELIKKVYQQQGAARTKIHPATKVFLSLRIWVNREVENLKQGLKGAFKILKNGGRLAVISFHSGEDRFVKKYFKNLAERKLGVILVRKPIFPSLDEVKINPSSRSAVLRAIKKSN